MAEFDPYFKKVLRWEGGIANDPDDPGGYTNMGVTIKTWRQQGWDNDNDGDIDETDLSMASKEQIKSICKKNFWDVVKGDQINYQPIANHIADFGWGSGPVTAVKRVQRVLGVADDGKLGPKTLAAINQTPNRDELLNKLVADRIDFLETIMKRNPVLEKYRKGWMNRVHDVVKI